MQYHWQLVNRLYIGRVDNAVLTDVTEEADLVLELLIERLLRAADDDARNDSVTRDLLDGVLSWLRFEFMRGCDVRDEGDMNVESVLRSDISAHLPNRLEEWEAFDVTNGAADLNKTDIISDSGEFNASFNLVRNMGNYLHRSAKVVATALIRDDSLVHLP